MARKVGEMERSRLVQRLERPWKGTGFFGLKDNPFSFGGGLKNGGLNDGAMDLLRGIFGFDYMGAAEFEFGAVPKALSVILDGRKGYEAFHFDIPFDEVAKNWREKTANSTYDGRYEAGSARVFVICPRVHAAEVERRIREWAGDAYNSELKEGTKLAGALRPMGEWDTDICGWLELNNGFFFFTDEEMWTLTASLFDIKER